MPTRADLASAALALAVHAAAGYALLRAPPRQPARASLVEVDVRERRSAPEPPRLTLPEPPAKPPAPEPTRTRPRLLASPPPGRAPPAPAPANPPRPVFGFSMDSAADDGMAANVPAGNTTAIDPADSAPHGGPVTPLPAARPRTEPPGALSIRELPDVDVDACGRSVGYPKEAQALGIEGAVRLRVALDETGRVVEAKVLSGLGHGLDTAAAEALLHHCKFTPAVGSDGRPVPYVIDPYVFHFEIPR